MHWADLPHLRAVLVCMGPAAAARMVRVSGYGWRISEPAGDLKAVPVREMVRNVYQ